LAELAGFRKCLWGKGGGTPVKWRGPGGSGGIRGLFFLWGREILRGVGCFPQWIVTRLGGRPGVPNSRQFPASNPPGLLASRVRSLLAGCSVASPQRFGVSKRRLRLAASPPRQESSHEHVIACRVASGSVPTPPVSMETPHASQQHPSLAAASARTRQHDVPVCRRWLSRSTRRCGRVVRTEGSCDSSRCYFLQEVVQERQRRATPLTASIIQTLRHPVLRSAAFGPPFFVVREWTRIRPIPCVCPVVV